MEHAVGRVDDLLRIDPADAEDAQRMVLDGQQAIDLALHQLDADSAASRTDATDARDDLAHALALAMLLAYLRVNGRLHDWPPRGFFSKNIWSRGYVV